MLFIGDMVVRILEDQNLLHDNNLFVSISIKIDGNNFFYQLSQLWEKKYSKTYQREVLMIFERFYISL